MINCYKILGVSDFASADEVKTAYRKLSKKLHPDVNDGDSFFEERFKEIQNAYEVLCDSRRKEIHDSRLKNTFSSSDEFSFKEGKTESKKEPQKAKTTTEKTQYTHNKTEGSNGKTASSETFIKSKRNSFSLLLIGVFIIVIVVIGIIVSLNNKQKGSDSNNLSVYSKSQSNAPEQYSNPTVQTPIYQYPENNTTNSQSQKFDDEVNQPHSINGNYFTIGSTKDEVLQVQGAPTSISKYEGMNEEVWSYEFSSINFKSGRVSEYSNISKNLRVQMISSNSSSADYFTIGSTKDEVLQVQGDPTSISKYEGMNEEVWSYEFSSITFKSGRVSEYSNISKNLRVRL